MAVKLVHVSDTHLRPFNPESGDILAHSGDALNIGSLAELNDFRKQLNLVKNNYRHIVFVAGNHDWIFEEDFNYSVSFLKEEIPNIHVLQNSAVVLEGLKFYGSSDQPIFHSWAFNKTHEQLKVSYANIPDDVNVLVTHCPPKGILDYVINRFNPNGEEVGSKELLDELPRLKQLRAHLYGHIHSAHGQKLHNGVVFSNSSICDEMYKPTNKPQVIELD